MEQLLPRGYQFRLGSSQQSALLASFMRSAYQELFPDRENFAHLPETVAKYVSSDTPIWWVESQDSSRKVSELVACLWMGKAIDQVSGDRFAYIFLIYVNPKHRRLGIGKALMQKATNWAIAKRYSQIGLQVFTNNQIALNLYHNLGFQEKSLLLTKNLSAE
jgi:ribosomal protein S18 acetylase RimI-like enzyme